MHSLIFFESFACPGLIENHATVLNILFLLFGYRSRLAIDTYVIRAPFFIRDLRWNLHLLIGLPICRIDEQIYTQISLIAHSHTIFAKVHN